jgi:hypothetical protein
MASNHLAKANDANNAQANILCVVLLLKFSALAI